MIRTHVWAAAAIGVLAALPAAAGMYDNPYALVEVADPSKVREEFSPAITQVDGKSTRNTRRSDPIEPGKHRVRIRFETAKVQQSKDEAQRDLDMNLEPCTRYRIAAKRTGGTSWEPVIYSEPIGECVKKFKKK
jgi:hypothetical protein